MFSSWAALPHLLALVWTDRNLRATSSTSHGDPVSCPGAAQERPRNGMFGLGLTNQGSQLFTRFVPFPGTWLHCPVFLNMPVGNRELLCINV